MEEEWVDVSHLWNSRPPDPPEEEKKMSRDADAVHVWRLKESSWLLKWYHFWYSPFVEKNSTPDFCKVSWAFIFAVPMIVGWVLIGAATAFAYPIFKMVDHRNEPALVRAREERKEVAKEARRDRRRANRAKARKIPEFLAAKTDATVGFVQAHPKSVKLSGQGILVIFGLGALYGIWMGSWWIVVTLDHNWVWSLFWMVIGGIAGAAVLLAALYGLIYWADSTGWGGRAGNSIYDHFFTPIGHGFMKIGSSFASFGGFLATAVHAVKTRTCPRIEIVKGE